MMKKRYIFLLAVLFTVALVGNVYAGSADARSANRGVGIGDVVGIGDLSAGNTVEVDSSGNIQVKVTNGSNSQAIDSNGNAAVELFNNTNQAAIDADGSQQVKRYPHKYVKTSADANVVNGACTISSIIVTGTSAGDYALIYDANSAVGDPEFDIRVGTALDTKVVNIPDTTFSTGVYVDNIDSDVFTTIIYDN